jgi:hypothetical protein
MDEKNKPNRRVSCSDWFDARLKAWAGERCSAEALGDVPDDAPAFFRRLRTPEGRAAGAELLRLRAFGGTTPRCVEAAADGAPGIEDLYRGIFFGGDAEPDPRRRAFAWLACVAPQGRRSETWGELRRRVEFREPGHEDFRNLDEDLFVPGQRRSATRTACEAFLKGGDGADDGAAAFLALAERGDRFFPAREMFLYAVAHCRSAERFAYAAARLRPRLGGADFVDALGYAPFFYTLFRPDSVVRTRDPAEPSAAPGILRAIADAGARPDRPCRFGFSWADVEAVADDFRAYARTRHPHLLDERERYAEEPPGPANLRSFEPANQRTSEPADLLRQPFLPDSLAHPFGRRETLLSDAICDASRPRPERARLLEEAVWRGAVGRFPLHELAGDVPTGFQDAPAARRRHVAKKLPGYRDIRCSDRFFFEAKRNFAIESDLDKLALEGIEADSPARLMMAVGAAGGGLEQKHLQRILLRWRETGRSRILDWLKENDETVKDLLDERTELFYVCANWRDEAAARYVEETERRRPGLAKGCIDVFGRNLLWYRLYCGSAGRPREDAATAALLRAGCDPDADTAWRLSWRDACPGADTASRSASKPSADPRGKALDREGGVC